MSRFPMAAPSAASRWIAAVLLIAAALPVTPRPIAADEIVLLGPPLVRKFPSVVFCPFPVELEFTASGSTAKIFVSANTYVFDNFQPPGSEMVYTHQGIDNIVVVRDSVYALHLLTNDESSPYNDCYYPPPEATVPFILKFDELDPGVARYQELFETGAPGWDLTQGCYHDPTRSAPLNPSAGSPTFGTGCLGLGEITGSPSLADTARTNVNIGGLIGGKRYVLTGWWSVDDGIGTDQVSITIKITGPDLVPLAQKTWGSLKVRYR